MTKQLALPTALVFALVAGGCSDSSKQAAPAASKPAAQAPAKPAAAAKKTIDPATVGSVSGSVKFTGKAPESKGLKMSADAFCELHGKGTKSESVVVNDNGTLANVFVYVKSGLDGYDIEVPSEPVKLSQEGCMFRPRIFGVMANQQITIHNGDATLHNVHALPETNKEFNLAMPVKDMEIPQKFTKPEVMVRFKCDVHPWMSAYAGVLPHTFHAVTGKDGSFSLEGLPPGTYTIEAWHETYPAQTMEVTVEASGSQTVDFTFDGKTEA